MIAVWNKTTNLNFIELNLHKFKKQIYIKHLFYFNLL